MTDAWWKQINGRSLAQGDLLSDCLLPVFASLKPGDITQITSGELKRARLIVMTQSCDLANNKVNFVALCPIYVLTEFEKVNPSLAKRGPGRTFARRGWKDCICWHRQSIRARTISLWL